MFPTDKDLRATNFGICLVLLFVFAGMIAHICLPIIVALITIVPKLVWIVLAVLLGVGLLWIAAAIAIGVMMSGPRSI